MESKIIEKWRDKIIEAYLPVGFILNCLLTCSDSWMEMSSIGVDFLEYVIHLCYRKLSVAWMMLAWFMTPFYAPFCLVFGSFNNIIFGFLFVFFTFVSNKWNKQVPQRRVQRRGKKRRSYATGQAKQRDGHRGIVGSNPASKRPTCRRPTVAWPTAGRRRPRWPAIARRPFSPYFVVSRPARFSYLLF